jgi:hypothetical protein
LGAAQHTWANRVGAEVGERELRQALSVVDEVIDALP